MKIFMIDWTRRRRREKFMRFYSTTVVSMKSLRYNLLLHRSSVKCWLLSRVLPHRAYSSINGYILQYIQITLIILIIRCFE